MRSLFKNVANELIQQMTPEDLKEIMDSTVVTVLEQMQPEERLAFSTSIVTNAVNRILDGLSDEQRFQLLQALLPTILDTMREDLNRMSPEEIADLVRARPDRSG